MIPDEVREFLRNAVLFYEYEHQWRYDDGESVPGVAEALAALDAQPQAPAPDWSQAPSWAMWAVAHFRTMAIGPVGAIWTFTDIEPTERNEFGWMMTGRRWGGVAFDIPFGVDPRTLKQRRPEVSNE